MTDTDTVGALAAAVCGEFVSLIYDSAPRLTDDERRRLAAVLRGIACDVERQEPDA